MVSRKGGRRRLLKSIAETNIDSYSTRTLPQEINYIDISSVQGGRILQKTRVKAEEAPGRARRKIRDGDVIWSNVRPNLRQYALVIDPHQEDVVSTGFTTLTPESVPSSFLYVAVTTDSFIVHLVNHATGASYPAVRPDDFERAKVLVPSSDVLAEFHSICDPIFRLANKLDVQNKKLSEARDLLLPRLISGQLDVIAHCRASNPRRMTKKPTTQDIASAYSENALVEQPAIELLASLGWKTANLYNETFGPEGTEGREAEHEVILKRRLRAALEKLNPGVPAEAYKQAIDELTRDRSQQIPVNANRDLYRLIRDRVKVEIRDEDGNLEIVDLKVIDWDRPENNEFFLASQMWVAGDMYRRRCDLIGFVNGIPFVFIEFKAPNVALKSAFDDNLRDYRGQSIPQLFHPNAFILLSNGSETKIGTLTSEWEHFFEWKRISDEGEAGKITLETALRGLCDRTRLLDIIENFTVFEETKGGLVKKIAQNHQYLGVNRAIAKMMELKQADPDGAKRLGVFWHTQGSGKSLSMVFFTEKVHRKLAGNWTFVIVTDREELDDQISKTFKAVGAVSTVAARATSRAHLQQLLTQDERYVFTLIQKFQTTGGERYPELSDRRDIIVITDEAHRSQYDVFAFNMRNALPHAGFLGFTGTPLIKGQEERTREVFGDYVSVYDFARSVEDGATVPLFYENRIPELQLTNENLDEDMQRLLEDAELDAEQEKLIERQFARQYQLIVRPERLDAIAKDIVRHFVTRGYRGKAMMVCIDKATAVSMYDRVQRYWKEYLCELKSDQARAQGNERETIAEKINVMETTDMAVVVSQSQNEVADLKAKGLDIVPHRQRMLKERLDEKFKDPESNLRLVFVCAMWITGFDVPTCSTLYLDKPIRNHTLMQTIARANRVAPGKKAGLIVDYVGIFRDLQKALAIYAKPGDPNDLPIKDKFALVEELKSQLAECYEFCRGTRRRHRRHYQDPSCL